MGNTARAFEAQSWRKAAQPPASVPSGAGCVSPAVSSPALQLLCSSTLLNWEQLLCSHGRGCRCHSALELSRLHSCLPASIPTCIPAFAFYIHINRLALLRAQILLSSFPSFLLSVSFCSFPLTLSGWLLIRWCCHCMGNYGKWVPGDFSTEVCWDQRGDALPWETCSHFHVQQKAQLVLPQPSLSPSMAS